jgi:hypothetical protein
MGFPDFAAALIRNNSVTSFFAVSFAAVRFASEHRRIGSPERRPGPSWRKDRGASGGDMVKPHHQVIAFAIPLTWQSEHLVEAAAAPAERVYCTAFRICLVITPVSK